MNPRGRAVYATFIGRLGVGVCAAAALGLETNDDCGADAKRYSRAVVRCCVIISGWFFYHTSTVADGTIVADL